MVLSALQESLNSKQVSTWHWWGYTLNPVFCYGHWHAGAYPEKGCEAGEGSGAQVPGGAAEGALGVYPGETEAQGRPHCFLKLPERRE